MNLKFLIPLLVAVVSIATANSAIVLSEFRGDHNGSKDSLDGLTLLVIGDDPVGGSTVPSDGALLAGRKALENHPGLIFEGIALDSETPVTLEYSDRVSFVIVAGSSGADKADLDANHGGALDLFLWVEFLDSVRVFESPDPGGHTYKIDGDGAPLGPHDSFAFGHAYRDSDGNWRIGELIIGRANVIAGVAIPEPSPAVLSLLGMLAALGVRRRR